MLRVSEIETFYGSAQALFGVSLHVPARSIVTVLGPNGAGKTTTVATVTKLLTPAKGRVELEGERIDHLPPEKIVRLGVSLVPQGRELFPEMSVLENLQMGAYVRNARQEVKQDLERVFEYFPILRERQWQAAEALSGGQQQMLAIGRALMSRPRLLVLDEPSLGLAPTLVEDIFAIIQQINGEGTTILLVEQNAGMALSISDYGYVLEGGRIVLEGEAKILINNEMVIRSYLGA